MPYDDVPHRIRTMDSLDQQAFDWVAPPQTASRGLRRLAYLAAALVLAVILAAWAYATPAGAIPGSTQNPDGSWTGPNGEDLGGGNPPSKPEPRQSHEGEPTGVMQCGCGYVVILRDGQSKAAAERACEAAVPAKKECGK
jgi:hypothetical protein